MSDQELIKACQAHQPKAQELLYQRYAQKLMGLCMRYGKSREDAEDMFQEAFVRVFKYIHQIKKQDSLDAWVRRIVVNTCINHYRKHKKHYDHMPEERIDQMEHHSEYSRIIEKMDGEELLKIVQQLPQGYRMVFNLYVIEGYSHKEIAKLLGTNENNSKSQLSKAKKALKKMLVKLNLIEDERRLG